MTRLEEIKYLKMALNLCDVMIDEKTADLVLRLHEKIKAKKGKTDMSDCFKIQSEWERDYEKNNVKI